MRGAERELGLLPYALPHDAVLEVRHVVVLAEPGLFQFDSLRENVEQPTTASEQDVNHVDPQLVDEPRGEVLLVDVRAHEPDPFLAGCHPRLRERILDSLPVTNVKIGSAPAGGSCATTKHGTSPSGPLLLQLSIELSYERRPMITAPVSSIRLPYTRSNTDGSSNAQLCSLIPSSPSPCSGLSLGAAI